MVRVTSFTSERMLEIEATTVVDGEINEAGNLLLKRRDGFTIDAGPVAGPKGDHGAGVYDVDIYYQAGGSGTDAPIGEWSENPPLVHPGDYLWVKTVTTYADPEDIETSFQTITYTVTRQPQEGSDGRGIVSAYTEYQEGTSAINPPQGDWYPNPPITTPGRYLWTKTTTTYTYGLPNIAYSVAKQGSDGTPGEPGTNQYLHVAYASSSDGTINFSTTDPTGRDFMGTATSFQEEDPTNPALYGWKLIRGSSGIDGVGVSSSSVRYQESESGTVAPSGTWTVEVPDVLEGNYLWSRSVINFTDGATSTSYSVSKQGARGQDGRGVVSITEEYYLSDSSTARSGGSWSTSRPTWVEGKFYWTRSTIQYTSGNPTTTTPICVSGSSGSNGSDGRAITNVDVYYYLSNSSSILVGGSWSTVAPSWVDGKYIWSKTVTTYSYGLPTESDPVCITGGVGPAGEDGQNGSDGDDGVSIVNVQTLYYLSTSADAPEGGSWSSEPPAWTDGKFVWTKTIVSYSEGPDTETSPINTTGAKGSTGKSNYTWIKYANDANGSGLSNSPVNKEYIGVAYNKETPTESTMPSDYTWSLIKGADGTNGTDGKDAVALVLSSSQGLIFPNNPIATTLTAKVYKGGVEVSGAAIAELGTIRWYKENVYMTGKDGSTLTVASGDVAVRATYEARLEY